jgi:hypothetical protein
MCAQPNQGGRWKVTQYGAFPLNLRFHTPVLGPVAGEQRMIFGLNTDLQYWNPVTQ